RGPLAIQNTRFAPLAGGRMGGGADGPLEGPAANLLDLFFHGSGQRDGLGGDADEILFGDLAIFQARFGDGGDDALLDLSAGPAVGETGELLEIEAGGIHSAAVQVNLKD